MKKTSNALCASILLLAGVALVSSRPMAQPKPKSTSEPATGSGSTATAAATAPVSQQPPPFTNLGFEDKLKDWTKTGSAFNNQPVYGDNVTVERAVKGKLISMPLGGTYWKKLAYPIGHKGDWWIGTSDMRKSQSDPSGGRQETNLTGTLVSNSFKAEKKYITFLVGGGKDAAKLRVELLVQSPTGSISFGLLDSYDVVAGTPRTGMNHDAFRREWWDVGALAGKTCRIRIADESTDSTWGYINVDDFVFTDDDPKTAKVNLGPIEVKAVKEHTFVKGDASTKGYIDWNAPIWGAVDMHAHPASHLGFGGKLLHGDPDGPLNEAMGSCKCSHGLWKPDNMCGNLLRGLLVSMSDGKYVYNDGPLGHPAQGYPDFAYWPHFTSTTHQQMWYGWIKRAYEGGLRVLVALTVNNHLLAAVTDGDPPMDDRTVSDAQIAYIKKFVANHSDFMEIAYSPAELRDIVRRNKLAVVLGTEMDNPGDLYNKLVPGELGPNNEPISMAIVENELDRQYCEGARYQFLVHLVDNVFSGAAVYNDMFNVAEKFTSVLPAIVVNPPPGQFGDVFSVGKAQDPLVDYRLETPLVDFEELNKKIKSGELSADIMEELKKGNVNNNVINGIIDTYFHDDKGIVYSQFISMLRVTVSVFESLSWIFTPFMSLILDQQGEYKIAKSYFLTADTRLDQYKDIAKGHGHQNTKPLSALGKAALKRLMDLGTMIDVDHMSSYAVTGAMVIANNRTPKYPLNSGHNGFRMVGSKLKEIVNENNRKDEDYKLILSLGGMMGVGIGYASIDPLKFPPPWNTLKKVFDILPGAKNIGSNIRYNCGGSSQRFAMNYLYAVELGGGTPVGLGTDTNGFFMGPGPRFGQYANLNGNVCIEQTANKIKYYKSSSGANDELQMRKDGNRWWDFNTDGMAHYGMMTDFFQDLEMIGVGAADMSPLFLSAERFARMWEKSLMSSTKTIPESTCASLLANASKGLGEQCINDDQCLSRRCDKTTTPKKCIPNDGTGGVGDYCTHNNHCKNLNCDLSVHTCKARADVGESCKVNSDCITNRCDAGPGTTGHMKCTCSGPDCIKGLYCTHDNQCKGYCAASGGGEGKCMDKFELKWVCDRNQMCLSGACDTAVKKCVPLNDTGKKGDYCTADSQCDSADCNTSGHYCYGVEALGGECGSNAGCISGACDTAVNKCVPLNDTGKKDDYCTADSQCDSADCNTSGHYCYGVNELGGYCSSNAGCLVGQCDTKNDVCVPNPNGGPNGVFCTDSSQCISKHCNVYSNKCVYP